MADQSLPMRYFSIAEGASVPRYGTGTFIAARRTPKGMVFDTERVVAIPAREVAKYTKEYARALGDGSLVERTKADFEAAEKQREAAEAKGVEERKRAEAEAVEQAKKQQAEQAEAERKLVEDNRRLRQERRDKALKAAKAEAARSAQPAVTGAPPEGRGPGKAGG